MINYSKYDVSTLPKSFVAIDFETLYPQRVSVCSVGMVKYIDGKIVDKFYTLIRPTFDYSTLLCPTNLLYLFQI